MSVVRRRNDIGVEQWVQVSDNWMRSEGRGGASFGGTGTVKENTLWQCPHRTFINMISPPAEWKRSPVVSACRPHLAAVPSCFFTSFTARSSASSTHEGQDKQ